MGYFEDDFSKYSKEPNKKKKAGLIVFILIIVIALICVGGYFGYNKFLKKTQINGVTLMGEIEKSVEFTPASRSTVVRGGELVSPVYNIYTDKKGNTAKTQVKDLSKIKIDATSDNYEGEELITLKDNKVIISEALPLGTNINLSMSYNEKKMAYTYIVKYDLNETIGEDMVITNPNDYDCIVNKKRHLASNYEPSDLTVPNVKTNRSSSSIKLRSAAASALEEMFKDAADKGYSLYAISGYRSYSTQSSIFSSNASRYGEAHANTFSAKPGESEHQLGLAMDVSCASVGYTLEENFGDTAEGKWIAENAHNYGFIIRFMKGKDDITGYTYEPWHVRYVGKTTAKAIYESGVTFEEYFQSLEE